jgi:acyl dehydratase
MSALRHVEAGTRLPPFSKVFCDRHTSLLYQRTLLLAQGLDPEYENYAAGPNVHTDDAAARAAGLPGRIVSGFHGYALISQALGRFFGMGWIAGGKLSIKFIRPFLIGESITCGGVVKRLIPSGKSGEQLAELDVWCQTPRGDINTAGTATVRVADNEEI